MRPLCLVLLLGGWITGMTPVNVPAADAPRAKDAAPRLPAGTDSVSRLTRASGGGSFTFAQRLEPVSEVALDQAETDQLLAIYAEAEAALRPYQGNLRAGAERRAVRLAWARALEDFVGEHPEGAWTPGVRLVLAEEHGRRLTYSKALSGFRDAYEATRQREDAASRRIAQESARQLARLLAVTGETDALRALVAAETAKDAERVKQTWFQALEIAAWNARYPNEAYKCGLQCLHQLARLTQPDDFDPLKVFLRPSSPRGYTIAELLTAAREARIRAQAQFTDQLAVFPVPAVVHLKVGHFVVVRRPARRVLRGDGPGGVTHPLAHRGGTGRGGERGADPERPQRPHRRAGTAPADAGGDGRLLGPLLPRQRAG